ncbi:MAG: SDR family NAD(P)-dependent oxidoreductase, partial [Cyanobacteria bacterium P01_H01_bin.121]
AVGSLKTNIGHLDAAAGVAGLIKTTLALKHRQIPPSLNFEQPNPQIDFDNSPFYVNTTLVDWPQAPGQTPNTPLRAGVSAFGIGGTNAHLILESAPPVEPSSPSRPWHLLLLSAKTPTALATATTHMTQYCQQHPELNLADVAYTLQVGRKAFEHRRMLVCQNLQEALTALEVPAPQSMLTQTVPAQRQSVVFLFPGQGSQYPDMGQALYQTEPLFREQVDHCCELIKPLLGIDLRPILYPNLNPSSNHASTLPRLDQTAYAQPALFITAYALAQLWQSWGIQPRAMLGHSIGEYVAACLAGVFSLEDALRLVVARGQLMQQCDPGSMLSVPRAAADLADLLTPTLAVAASNGPQLSVISGPTDAIAELQKRLSQASIESRLLHTSHAFHSAMMEPILEPFQQQVAQIQLNAPQIPFISNLTGTWIKPEEATNAHYWVQHLRQTVQLGSGIEVLSQNTEQIWLEVGPGKVLSTLVRRQYPTAQVLNSMRHPQASEADLKVLLTTLGRLWLAGVHVDWAKYYQYERRYRLPLPTYPFERQRYWIEPLSQEAIVSNLSLAANTPAPAANLLTPQRHPAEWLYRPYWQQAAPLLPLVPEAHATDHQCWLIFMDAWGIGSQMVAALTQLDQTVITVQPEADFQQLSPLTYGVNPQVREHYDLLLTELTASQQMPHHVVHLWGLTPLISSTTPSDALQQTQPFSFESVLFFSQALGTHTITDPLQLAIITHNLWDVTGEESLCPEQALVLGPCRVLPLEYPYLRCHHIDIVLPDGGRHATDQNPAVAVSTDRCQQLATQLLTELTTATTTSHFEIAVAYRGRHRWVQRFEPVAAEPSKIAPPRLRPEGVYLITGGLGGLGLAMAKQLAQSVQARLILVSRSGLPERTAWPQWLASHEATDRVSRQIHQVQTLIDLGAEVLVIAADVADGEQMRSTIAQATDKFGAVNGLIHAAGVAGEGLAQLKTRDTVKQVLAPKVNGTLVLDAILDQAELDFRVLFSSLNSVLGALGQIDYCAANAFLDSFAYASNIRGGPPTIAINWDTWQEVGMAVDTTLPAELQAEHEKALAAGIPTQTGAAILEQLLRSPLPQVLVSTQDFQAELAQRHTSWAAIETLDQFAVDLPLAEVPSSTYPRPHLSVDYVAPRNPLEQTIADIWQRFLGIESVGVYDDFLELGGHSLLAVQVISRLRTQFQVELPLQNLFEEPTIDRIATLIQAAQAGADTAPDNADGTVTSPTIAPVSRAAYRMKLSTLDQPATNQTSQLSQSNENGDKL